MSISAEGHGKVGLGTWFITPFPPSVIYQATVACTSYTKCLFLQGDGVGWAYSWMETQPWLLSLPLCLCSERARNLFWARKAIWKGSPAIHRDASRLPEWAQWVVSYVGGSLGERMGKVWLFMKCTWAHQPINAVNRLLDCWTQHYLQLVWLPFLLGFTFSFYIPTITPQSYSLCIALCGSCIKKCSLPTSSLSSASKRVHALLRHTGKQRSIAGG